MFCVIPILFIGCAQKYEWVLNYGNGKAGDQPGQIIRDGEYYYALGTSLREQDKPLSLILKFDREGRIIWDKYFGKSTKSVNSDRYFHTSFRKYVLADTKDFFIAVGATVDENENYRGYIVKLDTNGTGTKELVLPDFETVHSIHQAGEQFVVLAERNLGRYLSVISLDNELNRLWVKDFSIGSTINTGYILKENNSYLYLFFTKLISPGEATMVIEKFDRQGATVWRKEYVNPDDFKNIFRKTSNSLIYQFSAGNVDFMDNKIYISGRVEMKAYGHFIVLNEADGGLIKDELKLLDEVGIEDCHRDFKIIHEPVKYISGPQSQTRVFTAIDSENGAVCHCTIPRIDFDVVDFLIDNGDTIFAGYDIIDKAKHRYKWKIVKY